MTQIWSLEQADLPNCKPNLIEQTNRLICSTANRINLQEKVFSWQWRAIANSRFQTAVDLQSDNGQYQVLLTKNNIAAGSDRFVCWQDYDNDLACILWSAVNQDLISILELMLDEVLMVSNLNTGHINLPQPVSSEMTCIGFCISDSSDAVITEGEIVMPDTRLRQLQQTSRPDLSGHWRVGNNIPCRLPLVIDTVSLSCSQLRSLDTDSVIRITNSSVLDAKTRVSITIGPTRAIADITGNRGEIISISNNNRSCSPANQFEEQS